MSLSNMKKCPAFFGLYLTALFVFGLTATTPAKDINLGWSGQGSWTTLPYIAANERGFFDKEGLKVRLIREKPDYTLSLFDRILRVQPPLAEKLYKLYREQYNPELTLADSVVEDLLAVGTFRLKEKPKGALTVQAVRDWSFAEKARP